MGATRYPMENSAKTTSLALDSLLSPHMERNTLISKHPYSLSSDVANLTAWKMPAQ